jgi:hypothetical protein
VGSAYNKEGRAPRPMSDVQRRAILAMCAELGWDRDMRQEMCRQWVGKPSLARDAERPFTSADASEVLRLLRQAVREVRAGRRAQHRRQRRRWPQGQVTPEQLHRIRSLVRSVFIGDRAVPDELTDRAFLSWLRSKQRVDRAEWLTSSRAVRAVHAIEQLARSGWHPRSWSAPETPSEVLG